MVASIISVVSNDTVYLAYVFFTTGILAGVTDFYIVAKIPAGFSARYFLPIIGNIHAFVWLSALASLPFILSARAVMHTFGHH
ncbi:MAG: hypothetical protein ACYDD1_16615 [Caulobacteraceae bacterium]